MIAVVSNDHAGHSMQYKANRALAASMMLGLMTGFGAAAASAAQVGAASAPAAPAAAAKPVVDLRTRPAPATDLSTLPDTPQNRLIELGQQLINNTAAFIGPEVQNPAMRYSGTNMACASCHTDGATVAYAAPLIGTAAEYPQFIPRFGKMVSLEDRINLCMTHSMAGRPLPVDSREMQAFSAYIGYLSAGIPKGAKLIGDKEMNVDEPARAADLNRGAQIYAAQCAACHGANGEGRRAGVVGDAKGYTFPPLWGPDSTSESASMFRILSAFEYIYANMPDGQARWDKPALSKDDAYDVAGFMVSHARQPREGEVAKDFSNPYDKPADFPWGPYIDAFSETQHKYGPFDVIRKADAAAKKARQDAKAAATAASAAGAK
jgi:thiosulfate dehydrogenase